MDDASSPSRFSRRLPAASLALVGSVIACYLGACQLGLLPRVWEPLFGGGSARILHSSIATLLPIPDALLGAAAYLVELCLELVGEADRWHAHPLLTALNMALVAAMGLGSLGLVLAQPLLFGAWCTLCLGSAACSFGIVALSWEEMRAVATFWAVRARA